MHLDAIHLYPIKSCGGQAVDEAILDELGLVHDRRYMLVDELDRFVSLRSEPRLARVHVGITDAHYEVRLGEHGGFELPHQLADGPGREVSVWDDRVEALEHEPGSRAFRAFLGTKVRLVFVPRANARQVDLRFAREGDRVGFADAYPLLLIARETVADLSARVGEPMAMARFRPNLVIVGGPPYGEDTLATVRIGDVRFRGPKCCSRCTATTVDPATGRSGAEPLRTLAGYRRWNGKVWLGMNLLHDGNGRLRTGDRVDVLERHDRPPLG